MTNLTSYLLIASISVAVYAGLFAAVVWLRDRSERAMGAFAVYCFSAVPYWASVLSLYSDVTVEQRVLSSRIVPATAAVLMVAYVWFVGVYAGRSDRLVRATTLLFWGLLLVANVLLPYGVLYVGIEGMRPVHLPWGETVYQHISTPSVGGLIFFLSIYLTRFYAGWVAIWLYRRGDARRAWVLGIFVLFDLAGLSVDTAVVIFKIDFILVAIFSTLAAIVVMALYFSDKLYQSRRSLQASNEELAYSEQKFRSMAESSLVGIIILQNDLCRFTNAAFARMFGYRRKELTDLGPGEFARLVHPDDRDFVVGQATSKQQGTGDVVPSYVFRGLTKDGETRWAEIHSTNVQYDGGPADLALVLDITERRALEEQLAHSRKMDAVGQLAGGVAHDFNNILQTLMASNELLLVNMDGGQKNHTEDDRELAEVMLEETRRAASLTRKLLVLSRKDHMTVTAVDLTDLNRQLIKIMARILGSNIRITFTPSAEPVWVSGDPAQLEQVLLNLCINARDAMADGGSLDIALDTTELTAESPILKGSMEPGRYVSVRVTDTGHGMDEATTALIFDPFFTTKPTGKGTGLGLATVYRVVERHLGTIDVQSKEGHGTTFTLHLPVVKEPPASERLVVDEGSLRGEGTLLLAEDNDLTRVLMARILEEAGYTVIQAAHGKEALEQVTERAADLDFAVLDCLMAHASGQDVCKYLHTLRPRLPVLFVSGYSPERYDAAISGAREAMLVKPFSRHELLQTVQRLMAKAR